MSIADTLEPTPRPMGPAVLRGLRCKCPACGEVSMFKRYLAVHDDCPACGEDLSHQRADDGPAYLTMLVTLKVVTPLMVATMYAYELHWALLFTVFSALLVAMSLFLLPRFKGMIVAIQWSQRMHGFGREDDRYR